MSVQLIEGFEAGSGFYSDFSQYPLISRTDTAGPWSNYAATGNPTSWKHSLYNPANALDLYIACRFKVSSSGNFTIIISDTAGTTMTSIVMTAGLTFQVRDSSNVTKATGTYVNALNVWHLLELHFVVSTTVGLCDGRVEGLTSADFTTGSYNTRPNATLNAGAFAISSNGIDDLIIYDATGAQWNTWVGDKGVYGFYPNAKGDVNQLDPDGKTTSIARWYFPRTERVSNTKNTGYSSSLQNLAPDSQWEVTTGSTGARYRGELADQKRGSLQGQHNNPMTPDGIAGMNWTWTANQDVLLAQYVSPPLAAQTITGTFKCYWQVRQAADRDTRSQIVIRVVSNDGSTVRGVLYAGDTATSGVNPPSEWSTTITTRGFPRAGLLPATITNIGAITEGDRIVVELGFRAAQAGTADDVRFMLGDDQSADLPEDETTTSNSFDPWIEFSNGLTLSQEGNFEFVNDGAQPSGLTTSGNEPDSAPIDRDRTYVETSVDNERDLYHLTNIGPSYSVSGPLAIKSYQKKLDSGVRTLTHVYKTSGAEQSAGPYPLTTAWAGRWTLLDVDATDGAVWSDSKVNALQVGPKATT